MGNISWLFYKDYFRDMTFSDISDIKNANKTLIVSKNKKIMNTPLTVLDNPLAKQVIQVVVQYPGLITGTGINHEASIEGEFKLGMHFDYTYGMPIIHGSSVKGLLRSAFPDKIENKLRTYKTKYIQETLGEGFHSINVDKLRDHIFDGIENGEYISVYKRDVFFDAVILKTNKKGKMLDTDSITPHKKPLQNPIPVTFLKIASGVTVEFRFDLKDSTVDGIKVSEKQKVKLFRQILLDFGVGAKTNVGYGQFARL
jgi:CRISPR-associated protein Cmr6